MARVAANPICRRSSCPPALLSWKSGVGGCPSSQTSTGQSRDLPTFITKMSPSSKEERVGFFYLFLPLSLLSFPALSSGGASSTSE